MLRLKCFVHIYVNVIRYVCCFLVLFFPDTRKGKQTKINCDVLNIHIFEEIFKKVLEPGQNRNIISLTEMMLYDDEDDDTMSSF